MKVLFLGDVHNPLVEFLREYEKPDEVIVITRKLTDGDVEWLRTCDFAVSYGYRHIVRKNVIDLFPNKIINLHISYLPYNRGADPNFWSFIEDTPKGVTIHKMDTGLDTGDILVQRELFYTGVQLEVETLATTYEHLQQTMIDLFKESWPQIRSNQITVEAQDHTKATRHLSKDKTELMEMLPNGWNTTISELHMLGLVKH